MRRETLDASRRIPGFDLLPVDLDLRKLNLRRTVGVDQPRKHHQ